MKSAIACSADRLSKAIKRVVVLFGILVSSSCIAFTAETRDSSGCVDLFQVLMTNGWHFERCRFSQTWDQYPVPEDLARKYLGSRIYADVSAPFTPLSVMKVVDPTAQRPDAFCSKSAMQEYAEQRGKSFHDSASKKLEPVSFTSFSYPVFNRQFDTAVVIVNSVEFGGKVKTPDSNQVRNIIPDSSTQARIYKSKRGKWRLLTIETLAAT